MADDKSRATEPTDKPTEPSPFDRFADLTRRLLRVSKDDLRDAETEVKERSQRRPHRSA